MIRSTRTGCRRWLEDASTCTDGCCPVRCADASREPGEPPVEVCVAEWIAALGRRLGVRAAILMVVAAACGAAPEPRESPGPREHVWVDVDEESIARERIEPALARFALTDAPAVTCPCTEGETTEVCWRAHVRVDEDVRGVAVTLDVAELVCSIWTWHASAVRAFGSVDEAMAALPGMLDTTMAPYRHARP